MDPTARVRPCGTQHKGPSEKEKPQIQKKKKKKKRKSKGQPVIFSATVLYSTPVNGKRRRESRRGVEASKRSNDLTTRSSLSLRLLLRPPPPSSGTTDEIRDRSRYRYTNKETPPSHWPGSSGHTRLCRGLVRAVQYSPVPYLTPYPTIVPPEYRLGRQRQRRRRRRDHQDGMI